MSNKTEQKTNLTAKEFEEAALKGEITDFMPYIIDIPGVTYETGNVTWVRNLRVDRIANVLNAEQVLQDKELVLPLFSELLATKTFGVAHMIAINRKKELAK